MEKAMLISPRVPHEVRISVAAQAFGACVLATGVGRVLMAVIISVTGVPQWWALLTSAIAVAGLFLLAGLLLVFSWSQSIGFACAAAGLFVAGKMFDLTPDTNTIAQWWWASMFLFSFFITLRIYSEGWKRP